MRQLEYFGAIWKRWGVHAVWALIVVLSFYLSRVCAKIESYALVLIACTKAYESKSGSDLHDLRISVMYNGSLYELRRRKSGFLGGVAYWVSMKCNPDLESAFRPMEHLVRGHDNSPDK